MGSLSEDGKGQFFDAQDDMSSLDSYNYELVDSNCSANEWAANTYEAWTQDLESVKERRSKFIDRWFADRISGYDLEDSFQANVLEGEVEGFVDSSGASLRNYQIEDQFWSTRSSMSYNSYDNFSSAENVGSEENLDGRSEGNVGGVFLDRNTAAVNKEGLTKSEECKSISRSSPSSCQFVQRECREVKNSVAGKKRVKKGWLSKLRSISCIPDRQDVVASLSACDNDTASGSRTQRVKVRQFGKRMKELSALFMEQDIKAHDGAILAMKFSLDGQYLATAGEDGILRVWQVLEEEGCERDISNMDPSCMYFRVNHRHELTPLFVNKENTSKAKTQRKTSDSACVILPPKAFRILEKPLHEFRGHEGKILDLSWSNSNCLLSSSMDNTVRLWRVGSDHCLKIFLHSNYVTCVQFNPVDDDHFISGSIDGKVRVWSISSYQVIDWTEIKEIVSAVCYRPDGQGMIVGSMTANCHFYNMAGNNLQLDAQICLTSKKKSPSKRITGFQFFPQDTSKLLVTTADSRVRILHGLNIVSKYKGLYNPGNRGSSSLTSKGRHIISACEDSNVYVWNCIGQEEAFIAQPKKIRSCEQFSANASVAIPWSGLRYRNSEDGNLRTGMGCSISNDNSLKSLTLASPPRFFLSQDFILDSFSKGSATWPEEKLPKSTPSTSRAIHKSQYKFLKASCQSHSHAWGLVIVSGGWDGRIRSFHNYGLPVTT